MEMDTLLSDGCKSIANYLLASVRAEKKMKNKYRK